MKAIWQMKVHTLKERIVTSAWVLERHNTGDSQDQ